MNKEEILRLYREDAGYNAQDLIKILDSKLDGGDTRSLDDSLVIFHLEKLVVAVSANGVEFFQQEPTVLAVLSDMKGYIESTEKTIDAEWGSCRDFDAIHKAGEVIDTYDVICEILSDSDHG